MALVREGAESLTDAYLAKPFAPAICLVDKIYPHRRKWNMGAGDRNFDVIDIHLRDIRKPPENLSDLKIYRRAIVLQRYIGNGYGSPWTPRVGDLVLVMFLHDNLPIILGTLYNIYQEPVCRPNSNEDSIYDIVHKICKWSPPKRSHETEYNWVEHPFAQYPPVCLKYFDKTRDCVLVHTCPHGYQNHDEVCEYCNIPDYIDGGTYLKVLSGDTESKIDPKWRTKFHHISGSLMIFDENGTIFLENRVNEDPRGHILYTPPGTIDVHSDPEETNGSHVLTVAEDDSSWSDNDGEIAVEMCHKPTMAIVRIYKSGKIVIRSGNNSTSIRLGTDGNVSVNGGSITLNNTTTVNGDLIVNGCIIINSGE